MNGKGLLQGLEYIDKAFLEEAGTGVIPKKKEKNSRKLLLCIAAILGLLVSLAICTAVIF